MLNKLIVFLICLKLHWRADYAFQFAGQTSNALYLFVDGTLMKMENGHWNEANDISLNWLLHHKCKVQRPQVWAGLDEASLG